MKTILGILPFIFAATGCGVDLTASTSPGDDLEDRTLSGVFGGEPWTFVSGQARPGFGSDEVRIELYAASISACSSTGTSSGKYIVSSVPAVAGEHLFSLSEGGATFITPPARNQIALEGRFILETVTESVVAGGLVARFNDDTTVNGRFSVPRCK